MDMDSTERRFQAPSSKDSPVTKRALKVTGFLEEFLKIYSITEALSKTFELTNKEVERAVEDIEFSGSTSVMVFVNGQELYTANVGDSRAIICTLDNGGIVEIISK